MVSDLKSASPTAHTKPKVALQSAVCSWLGKMVVDRLKEPPPTTQVSHTSGIGVEHRVEEVLSHEHVTKYKQPTKVRMVPGRQSRLPRKSQAPADLSRATETLEVDRVLGVIRGESHQRWNLQDFSVGLMLGSTELRVALAHDTLRVFTRVHRMRWM